MMMSDSAQSTGERGYLIAPVLENISSGLWLQSDKEIAHYLKKSEEQEGDGEEIEDDSTGWEPPSKEEWAKAERNLGLG